jgi:VWFA-related protein
LIPPAGRALAAAVLAAAAAVPAAAQDQRSTFGVTTRVVQVSVVVRDKAGRTVADLTARDFRLFEDGKEQPIESFSVESTAAAARVEEPAGRREFSNRLGGRAAAGVTVILLDRLNTRFEDQARAREQIVRFLGTLAREDRVALYVLEPGAVRVLHDFTTDTGSLLRAVARHQGLPAPELDTSEATAPETGEADMDAFLSKELTETSGVALAQRVRSAAAGLEAIANHLAGVLGRKNLVWVSSGFPLVVNDQWPRIVTEEVGRATRALNDAGIAVYPVDPRGLVGAYATNPAAISSTKDSSRALREAFTTLATTRPDVEGLKTIADDTGGRAFYDTNDISGALRQAVDDSRLTYVLGYAPSHGKWDGKFHEIKVTVSRGGLDVRHRRGYLALQARGSGDPAQREAAVLDAVRSPLQATGLGLGARVEPATGDAVNLAIRLDPASVSLAKNGDTWQGAFDLAIVQALPDGTLRKSLQTTVELNLTAELRERLLRQGIVVNRKVAVLADALRLHVVARDVATGATGSLIIPADRLRGEARQ